MTKKVTLDDLARMVANGFSEVDTRFDSVENRLESVEIKLESVDSRLEEVEGRLKTVERNISYIHDHVVDQDSFDDLCSRVKYIEKKLQITSGK